MMINHQSSVINQPLYHQSSIDNVPLYSEFEALLPRLHGPRQRGAAEGGGLHGFSVVVSSGADGAPAAAAPWRREAGVLDLRAQVPRHVAVRDGRRHDGAADDPGRPGPAPRRARRRQRRTPAPAARGIGVGIVGVGARRREAALRADAVADHEGVRTHRLRGWRQEEEEPAPASPSAAGAGAGRPGRRRRRRRRRWRRRRRDRAVGRRPAAQEAGREGGANTPQS